VEREGIDKDVVEQALAQYRALEGKRSMPDHKYREVRARPLLLLHIVSPYLDERPLDTGGTPLVALGLSFPTFDDHEIASRAVYRVNLVEWRNLFELEADDDDPDEEVGGAVA
jgi:hypothetical protein